MIHMVPTQISHHKDSQVAMKYLRETHAALGSLLDPYDERVFADSVTEAIIHNWCATTDPSMAARFSHASIGRRRVFPSTITSKIVLKARQ